MLPAVRSCRSSIPVCAAVASVIIEHKIPSKSEATALVVLTLGVMMAVSEGLATSNLAGVVLCIAGTVSNAALVCTSGKLLSEKMDVLLLTFYTAPISCASLLPGFVFREVSGCDSSACPVNKQLQSQITTQVLVSHDSYTVLYALI